MTLVMSNHLVLLHGYCNPFLRAKHTKHKMAVNARAGGCERQINDPDTTVSWLLSDSHTGLGYKQRLQLIRDRENSTLG